MNGENQSEKKTQYKKSDVIPPEKAKGFPSRSKDLDAYAGFVTPPEGYGEVAFYWWLGDKLDKKRIRWQLDRLKDRGVMGLQVNYAHSDQGGFSFGYTYPSDPPLFSEEWWELFGWFLKEAKKENIAVSLSDYTLAAPGQKWFTDEVIAENPDMVGAVLDCRVQDVDGGTKIRFDIPENAIHIAAYPRNEKSGGLSEAGVTLDGFVKDGMLEWEVPGGKWRIVTVFFQVNPYSVDPMNPAAGPKIIQKFFQRFEDRNPGEGGKGLDFFFSDELSFGVSGNLWNSSFAEEFKARKGYDIIPEIAALFEDVGPRTPKIRMDYRDVMVALEEEGYFKPVFDWHQKRGMIYGCDHGGRGKDVTEFGDYFRTQRWNQGPGNDQPFLYSDIIKNKVSSSIAHLYERPRAWLEGFHSSGWSTSSAQVADATFRNFISGHNLLTLHGLYYSTHGGWWEWAPPCNHFRMPYWEHMGEFLKCSERLSYLLSQGVHRCDVAVMYPVAPMEAGMDGDRAVETAFAVSRYLYDRGMDFDFMDFQSLERSVIEEKKLKVAGEAYQVLILPHMKAIRYSSIEKALEFYRAGGIVLSVGDLPAASDRAGSADPVLENMLDELFGCHEIPADQAAPRINRSAVPGGVGAIASTAEQAFDLIQGLAERDFVCLSGTTEDKPCWVMHRKVGYRDLYMLYGVPQHSECFFRAKGKAELWDPWSGSSRQLPVLSQNDKGTRLLTPLEPNEAQLILFDPTQSPVYEEDGAGTLSRKRTVIPLDDQWEFELKPTMDNRWGDFRMPAFEGTIGAEARRFRYHTEDSCGENWESPAFDDSGWPQVTHSYGPRFYQLGPLEENAGQHDFGKELCRLKSVNGKEPFVFGEHSYFWRTCDFSDRWGAENAPGHQGYHGLKEIVSDQFIALGKTELSYTGSDCLKEGEGSRYYLWTTVFSEKGGETLVCADGLLPDGIWLNGCEYDAGSRTLPLQQGNNCLLLSYEGPGRAAFVLETGDAPKDWKQTYPLAMTWYHKPGVLPFNIHPDHVPTGWYRFTSPPGLSEMELTVYGKAECWVGGIPAQVCTGKENADGSTVCRIIVNHPQPDCQLVALRIEPVKGFCGGAAIPEPIALHCKEGTIRLGDWSKIDGLTCYSGGARYRKTVTMDSIPEGASVTLDLGSLVSSAEVIVNGSSAGIRVAPPWKFDITRWVRSGENQVEVIVYNTLANHYLTIPTRYRGSLESGLMGPVSIQIVQ